MKINILIPPLLKKGDLVFLVAPSGYVNKDSTKSAIAMLEAWGLKVKEGESLYKRRGIFAGSDKERLADLQEAINNADVKAIICARGGYGLSRIIDKLDLTLLKESPKWVVGFSDITVLHYYIMSFAGIPVIHSAMLLNFTRGAESIAVGSLRDILFTGSSSFQWDSDKLVQGEVRAVLAGGNLSLLCSLLGVGLSEYLEGKILFIEDIGEHQYRIDRMLMSMRLAGVFDLIAGLVVGGISDVPEAENDFGRGMEDMIMDAIGRDDIPIAFDFSAGHIFDNRALYLGREYFFRVDALNAVLSCMDC